ncbi:PREDICTED: ketohexokinase-like [Branchiostoma belcheri]|uniref:Ketohexokinase n=1 Tax=Branchiostoma belcheri TaxID=7741 RepID=A0A6P4YI68_BRABE|nr:PREDICTED: ketohexokinase-like [Branchiostoma belcheri]
MSATGKGRKRVLMVGLLCQDILNLVDHYPTEDEDVRCVNQFWQKGGNAANSACVLSSLGEPTEYLGTVSSRPEARCALQELQDFGVLTEHVVYSDCPIPTSCVIINTQTGSRTIVHGGRNMAELTAADFSSLDLNHYKWIHFEGRNTAEVCKMMEIVEEFNRNVVTPDDAITLSTECEKPKYNMGYLIPKVDVLFMSKEYAESCGFSSAEETVKSLLQRVKKGSTVLCTWGDQGADGITPEGTHYHCKAFPPEKVVDTLGAGDTFNAAVISGLCRSSSLEKALRLGCRIAGQKCGQFGYKNLHS